MEPALGLLVVLIIGAPLALAIWLVSRAIDARKRAEELAARLGRVELDLYRLKQSPPIASADTAEPTAASPAWEAAQPAVPIPPIPAASSAPTASPSEIVPEAEPVFAAAYAPAEPHAPPPIEAAVPPPFIAPRATPVFAAASPPAKPAINWEQFMGVKGFAWLGGLALFLGVAFFVKYSFDNNLVPPQLRVAIGFLTGIGLLVGGLVMSRKNFPALSQTLCATGVVILYAVTFACHALYHFAFFSPIPTFLLMSLITATAFLLAARLNALVVAILGMLGGFLTPILLSTGQDNPFGLFGYIAMLDCGLILVALNRRWDFLAALAALGTVVLQWGWTDKFFVSGKYIEGNKILIPLGVLFAFNALWLGANWLAKRRGQSSAWITVSNFGLAIAALGFAAFYLTFPPLADRPALIFGFVFLIDLAVAALAALEENMSAALPLAGLAVFGLLESWTDRSLTNAHLNAALAFYFLFALLHTALPGLLERRRDATGGIAARLGHLFPPLALLLVLIPIFRLTELSFAVWPFVLLVDLLAIVLAALTMTLLPVLAILALTLAATAGLILKIPANLTGLPFSFVLLAVFAIFFVTAGVWFVRKVKPGEPDSITSSAFAPPQAVAALLASSSAVLPFLLLIMATLRLSLHNPAPIFGLSLLLAVLLLGLTIILSFDWLPILALVCVFAVECTWHFERWDMTITEISARAPLTWYLIFLAVFAAFPFLFLKRFSEKTVPWAAAALAGPAQFLLIFRLVKAAWPNSAMGALPAVFALPALASLVIILKNVPYENRARLTQLAWFGGVALFFITLIFPIQFDRQWITIGWALEGAALFWLFHRVPHPGLRLTGAGLLCAAFVRLAFNPAVLEYHQRSATPIFNWYLYTYGIATAALFVSVRLLAPPRNMILNIDARPVFATLGAVLAFLLMNIEIADYFSAPGSTLTFEFSGNFGRDMTYSIAWALFALGLLVFGIYKKLAPARYAAMALLCVTLVKLFFHDLARLGPLYRIGALIGVAVIAMVASFVYQKFFSATTRKIEVPNEG